MHRYRSQFPILGREVRGKPLAYLDNAATTLKPLEVVKAVEDYYSLNTANIHRGVHFLSEQATEAFEGTRQTVADFLGSVQAREVVFTAGTTASINLVAHSFLPTITKPGDEVVITHMEHHANIVPWQLACQRLGLKLRAIALTPDGELDLASAEQVITEKTKLLAFVQVSNALGTVNPVSTLVAMAKRVGAYVLVDGAQAVAHAPTNLPAMDCDFYVFSAHKLFGPTGVGVLFGKQNLLDAMPPFLGGGDMIHTVSIESSTYAPAPHRFEAGTPHIAGVLGLDAAIKFVRRIGFDEIISRERALLQACEAALSDISGVRLIGRAKEKAAIVSFVVDGVHPHDLGSLLDAEGVAIRAGHHCCQPLMDWYGLPATARASMSFYNEQADIDALIYAVKKAQEIFA